MVGQVVAGNAMYQHIQTVAVLVQPRDKTFKFHTVERELATPVRVRTDFTLMHPPHGYLKKLTCLLAQRAGLLKRLRPEVDMGVVVRIDVLGALDHLG